MTFSPSTPVETLSIGGGRRLAMHPEALYLETRGSGGVWLRTRAIAYSEIRALYSYETRDWSHLAVASGGWLLLVVLLLSAAALTDWPGELLTATIALATLLLGGYGWYRFYTAPRKLLRIDALSGTLVVPNRLPGFFGTLSTRLPRPDRREAFAGPPEDAAVPPAPAGDWRVEGLDEGEPSPTSPGNA